MRKVSGLQRRWLQNTITVVCALGIACVLAVTASFAAYYYNNLESDMHRRASESTEFFAEYLNQNYNEYYQSCITYAQTFEERNHLELQFINAQGRLVVTSYGHWAGPSPATSDIAKAINNQTIEPYVGIDPGTGERIIAVSSPMIYSNGEVIGVLRYVTSTRVVDGQILRVAFVASMAFLVIMAAILLSSSYYIRSILVPVAEITEIAKRIAAGSYGVQIKTHYDDEIGDLAKIITPRTTTTPPSWCGAFPTKLP